MPRVGVEREEDSIEEGEREGSDRLPWYIREGEREGGHRDRAYVPVDATRGDKGENEGVVFVTVLSRTLDDSGRARPTAKHVRKPTCFWPSVGKERFPFHDEVRRTGVRSPPSQRQLQLDEEDEEREIGEADEKGRQIYDEVCEYVQRTATQLLTCRHQSRTMHRSNMCPRSIVFDAHTLI